MRTEVIKLTANCLKEMGMLARTDKGKEIRKYFLECERLAKLNYKKQLDPLEAKADPEIIKAYRYSIRVCNSLGDRNGVAVTVNQLNEYLSQFTIPEKVVKPKPRNLKIDSCRKKIFDDLITKAVDGKLTHQILSGNSILRRNDIKKLYAFDKNHTELRKLEIIKMLEDAAKYGYGVFEFNVLTLE